LYSLVIETGAHTRGDGRNSGDFEKSEKMIARAKVLVDDGRAAQVATNIRLARVNELLNKEIEDTDEARQEVRDAIASMITAAREVVAQNIWNYRAWLQLGDLYAQLGAIRIEGAYDASVQAYQDARNRHPLSPIPALRIAQVAASQEDYKNAQAFIEESLRLKPDYTDAYYLLSRMAIAQDNIDDAVTATEQAVLLQPDNAGLLFQLGVLHYSREDYEKVVPVLERAVALNPNYVNAFYFLGLAHDQLGNRDAALTAFKRIQALNPDNAQIKDIVIALESGKSVFTVLQGKAPDIREDSNLPVSTPVPVQAQ